MIHADLDALHRDRFAWPEPLVTDLIREHYEGRVSAAALRDIAGLQGRMLQCLVEDDHCGAATLRAELIGFCGAHGIRPDEIADADRAVIYELMRVVGNRFRNSPRLRNGLGLRLEAILAALTADAAPALPPEVSGPSLKAIRDGWIKSSSAWRARGARARVAAAIA